MAIRLCKMSMDFQTSIVPAKLIAVILMGAVSLLWFAAPASASEQQVQYFPQIAAGGGYTTTLYFTGYGSGTSTIDVEIFDKNGIRLALATDQGTGSIFHLSLSAYGTAVLRTLDADNSVKSGWVKVTSTPPVGATVTYKYVGGAGLMSQASVLPLNPTTSATLFVPDARNTAIALLAPGGVNDVTFRLLDKYGNPVVPTSTYSLQPWNRVALYVNQIPGFESVTALDGSLEISGSTPFSVTTLIFEGQNFATAPIMAGRTAPADARNALVNQFNQILQQSKDLGDQLLPPSTDDLKLFANFLSQPQTGLLRLLPRETYYGYLTIEGGGAYYSFTHLTHAYGYGSDIELYEGDLNVGFAGADFGFMISLGDVAIDSVTLDHPAIQYLAAFPAPTNLAEARIQQQRAGAGFSIGSYSYRDSVRAAAATTYALRSLCFEKSDVLVIFRVVRFDPDGSAILAWKLFKAFPVPHLQ
jgi:hypothetical protein